MNANVEATKVETLRCMGFDLDTSVLAQVLRTNDGDIDKATDELLTMAACLDRTQVVDSYRAIRLPSEEDQNMKAAQPSKHSLEDLSSEKPAAPSPQVVSAPSAKLMDASSTIYSSATSSITANSSIKEQTDSSTIEEIAGAAPSAPAQASNPVPAAESAAVLVPNEPLNVEDLAIQLEKTSISDGDPLESQPGRFFIYRRSDLTVPKINEINSIKELLNQQGIRDIMEVDLTHDAELAGFIKAKCGTKYSFPVVFFRQNLIGGIDDLKLAQSSGALAQLLKQDAGPSPRSTDQLQLNVLDHCLNAAETVLTWLNPVSWWRSKPQEAPSDVVQFDVVQSNWYWRHQHRKLLFASDYFARIHPTHNDVRAAHKFESVSAIRVLDAQNLVVSYKDFSSPDFFRCRQDDLPKIVSLIVTRAKNYGTHVKVDVAAGVTGLNLDANE